VGSREDKKMVRAEDASHFEGNQLHPLICAQWMQADPNQGREHGVMRNEVGAA
jgi:hypothetical protein